MYEELIEILKPCPILNLDFYKEKDLYSEGEIEDVIINIIAENEPEEYTQAIADYYSWSTFYHLTHVRKNILNWYPFDKEASVLEIGCGMGAITSVLCDRCKDVTAVELSKRRAIATLLRCREKQNLEIIVGNLNDIEFQKKYDYITLIGVLEYQGSYTNTENPYLDFIKKIKKLLKPGGKLLIAIENQYGLKYWCGACEDHTGMPFEGMNQYTFSQKKVRTFSKEALRELLNEGGLPNTYFYYPMPDYKLPTVVYSQEYLPKNEHMLNTRYYYIPNKSTLVAQEEKIYRDIIRNNVFEFFANSFLVECSESNFLGEVTFATLSCKRSPEYQVGTKFLRNGKVEKFALNQEMGEQHLEEIIKNEENLLNRGLSVWRSDAKNGTLISDYLEAKTMEEVILEAYNKKDIAEIYRIWDRVQDEIEQSSETASWEENLLYTFGLDIVQDKDTYGKIIKTGYLDMTLRNAFWMNGKVVWFDQEWILENVPSKFVLYRAINQFYASFSFVNEVVKVSELVQHYGLLPGWKGYELLDNMFMGVVIDQTHMAEYNGFCGNNENVCLDNVRRFLK